MQSSYKIAHALRKTFNKIIVFVRHIAASGGTLLALTGNKIVMGMMSQLSPLDPQAESEEGAISANSVLMRTSLLLRFLTRWNWRMRRILTRLLQTSLIVLTYGMLWLR